MQRQSTKQCSPCLTYCVIPITILAVIGVLGLTILFLNMKRNDDQQRDIRDLKALMLETRAEFTGQINNLKEVIGALSQLEEEILPCLDNICDDFPEGINFVNLVGCWDANTNTPIITSSVGDGNDAYVVCVGGITMIDGENDWDRGDVLVFVESEGVWIKNDGTPTINVISDTDSLAGSEVSIIADGTGPFFELLKIVAGTGINVTEDGETITIQSDFEALPPTEVTLSNVGVGGSEAQVLVDPGEGSDFSFRSLNQGVGIDLTQTGTQVTVAVDVIIRSVTDPVGTIFLSAFDAIGNTDFDYLKAKYVKESSFCVGTKEHVIGCLCTVSYDRRDVYVSGSTEEDGRSFEFGFDSCTCEYAIIGIRNVPQTVKVTARVVCLTAP